MRGHIRKHRNAWEMVIYIGRDQQTGKKRYKSYTHATRREAEAHLTQVLAQVQAGGGIPPTRLRLGDYLDQWLNDRARVNLAPSTFQSYWDTVKKHIAPALGHMPLARLSAPAIQNYLTRKLEQKLSTTTVRYHAAILNEALNHAVRWSLLVRNPMKFVELPRRRRLEMRVWDEEQVRVFLAEAKRSSANYVLYLTAILTGMRQGELLGLQWQDVDFLLGTATVQRTFYRLGKQQIVREPKTAASRRTIPLVPVLLEELRQVRTAQAEHKRLLGPEYEDRSLVFCQANGKPVHAHNIVQRDFRRVTTRAKVPRIRFHDLRHCHATHMLRAGVNLKVVQERLGHSTAAFTLQVYSHVLRGMQEDASKLVAERLLGTNQKP